MTDNNEIRTVSETDYAIAELKCVIANWRGRSFNLNCSGHAEWCNSVRRAQSWTAGCDCGADV